MEIDFTGAEFEQYLRRLHNLHISVLSALKDSWRQDNRDNGYMRQDSGWDVPRVPNPPHEAGPLLPIRPPEPPDKEDGTDDKLDKKSNTCSPGRCESNSSQPLHPCAIPATNAWDLPCTKGSDTSKMDDKSSTVCSRRPSSVCISECDNPDEKKGDLPQTPVPNRFPGGVKRFRAISIYEEFEDEFELCPIWRVKHKVRSSHRTSRQISVLSDAAIASRLGRWTESRGKMEEGEEHEQEDVQRSWCSKHLVAPPNSTRRLGWSFFGLLLIFYDLIAIPLQFLDPPSNYFMSSISTLSTIFWTLDIPSSFLVGFHRDGIVEMKIPLIAKNYIQTWFPFDLVVVLIDWTLTIAEAIGDTNMQHVGFMRFGKTIKFLRLLRLLRLLKGAGALSELIERIQSEWFLIMAGIFKLLFGILLINHFIACIWYGIGKMQDDSERCWTRQYLDSSDSLSFSYLTSLHWSMTQFTPASMEVVPHNTIERLFAVCVISFAMVTFSSFVSTITNAMTQLRNLNAERTDNMITMRKYFHENRVSISLVARISACLQHAAAQAKSRVHENEVKVFQMLPWNLKGELQEEVYSPILGSHPFWLLYFTGYKIQSRKLYQCGLEEVSLNVGHELFNSGETSTTFDFVLMGMLSYNQDNVLGLASVVGVGQWFCEPSLWIGWKHSGQMVATTHAEIIALRIDKIQEVLANSGDGAEVKRYANEFQSYFRSNPELLSDIWADLSVLTDLARKAFVREDREEFINVVPTVSRRLSLAPRMSIFGLQSGMNLAKLQADNASKPEGRQVRVASHSSSDDDSDSSKETESEQEGQPARVPADPCRKRFGSGNAETTESPAVEADSDDTPPVRNGSSSELLEKRLDDFKAKNRLSGENIKIKSATSSLTSLFFRRG